jgi:arylsulfatase A-like enzyme
MRIIHIDIDSLRPDHLGCYDYGRNSSPNIDAIARESVIFDNVYVSDAPCLPSRTALWAGRCGLRTGVVNHGGRRATPFNEGPERWFRDTFIQTGWMAALRAAAIERIVTVSSFGERHSAWHWYAGFNEVYNSGQMGLDMAGDVAGKAIQWLERNGTDESWFLHVNFWDPHTPYRAPAEFGDPFKNDALPAWLNEDVRQAAWEGFGPHSAQDLHGLRGSDYYKEYPRMPASIDSMSAVRQWIDGYDTGIRYMDEHIGRLVTSLDRLGILNETLIVISADHGENQGELNVWGDHQTADHWTCRVPLIVRWPGGKPRRDSALYYQYDWAATLIELLGGQVPERWCGRSFAGDFNQGQAVGRPYLVVSQNAWACQRGVRFENYMFLRTFHDGFKALEPVMVFDLTADPHEQHDIAGDRPDLVEKGIECLESWLSEMVAVTGQDTDPMWTVLQEGGPFHVRGDLDRYVERLRATGRGLHAARLLQIHGGRHV